MAPRGFDRYMVALGMGTNRKFAKLTDSEFRAHVVGVLAVAAQSPLRGYLLIGDGVEAGAEEIAAEAGVTVRVAASALAKLARVGVLQRDDEMAAWFVHDWDEFNPPPKRDSTAADRQRRFRDRHRNAVRNGDVTPLRAVTSRQENAAVTPLSRPLK